MQDVVLIGCRMRTHSHDCIIADKGYQLPVQDAKVDKGSVHDVVLVGGSVRIQSACLMTADKGPDY